MNKFSLYTFLLFSLIVTGCFKKSENKNLLLTKKILENTVIRAINGVKTANDSLSNLIDYSLPLNPYYNQLSIDSTLYNKNRVLFTLLITYNNPLYNRFAVFNTNLDAELIDKSLNGNIYKEKLYINGNYFLKLTEDFLSKDIFNLTRISLYKVDTNSVNLVFRTFSRLKEKRRIYTQDITEITNDRIKTKLNSSVRSRLRNKSDVFPFSSLTKKYESNSNLFYNYIFNKISRARVKLKLPLITDKKSALATVGLTSEHITTNKKIENKSPVGFSINLSKTWKRFDNFMIRSHLIKGKKGTRFLNSVLGATISIIRIDNSEDITDYTKYPFVNETNNPLVNGLRRKSTERMIYGKSFYQLIEYIGRNQKFLLIINGSKYTFDKYEKLYLNILSSFKINT
ncbi:MAG: hypothetical protein IIC75_04135 [Bacteroidetes bacterium]|nr:hypothetical protein [Bacteroidota bacterium]